MKIIGIDPGSQETGFGIIEYYSKKKQTIPVAYGIIQLRKIKSLPAKLKHLFNELDSIIKTYRPQHMAVEDVFYAKNPRSTIKMGEVRGTILVVGALNSLEIYEYSATDVKKNITTYGQADKEQLRSMVKRLLDLEDDIPYDASDALAIALCHTLRL